MFISTFYILKFIFILSCHFKLLIVLLPLPLPLLLQFLSIQRYPLLTDPKDGSIFIDRDGEQFRYILNFLRNSDCPLPKGETEREELKMEASYYQLDGLVKRLEEMMVCSRVLEK